MEERNNFWTILLTVVITAIVVGGGVYLWQQSEAAVEEVEVLDESSKTEASEEVNEDELESFGVGEVYPLSYDTRTFYDKFGVAGSFSKTSEPFDYTVEKLIGMNEECGNVQTEAHFNELISKFEGTSKILYNFSLMTENSQTFIATLLPNKPGYSSLNEFKKDFEQCYAGGEAYPHMLNNNWLLFISSCGTGFSDGTDKPFGCAEIRDEVTPTFELN